MRGYWPRRRLRLVVLILVFLVFGRGCGQLTLRRRRRRRGLQRAVRTSAGCTMTTSAGQKVTVNGASATTYADGSDSVSASAVTDGTLVLVLGTVNSTTITAAQVIVEPAGNKYTMSSSQVVPFQRGKPSTSKTAGAIPPGWNEGQGTIVSGTAADKGTEAALAAYPGAVVDRVTKLSSGDYNVHFIGVNWPHHAFLNSDFQVIGAE
jgi:hypothetical protein